MTTLTQSEWNALTYIQQYQRKWGAPRELINGYIVKNRFGKQGDVTLGFDETSLRFYSATVTQHDLGGE